MQDTNSVTLVGRLTKDGEVKTFDNGGSIINFSIAVNRSVKKGDKWEDEASYIDVRYSTKSVKISEFLKKGTQVAVDGFLKQERWQNKEGVNNSKIVVVAGNIQLLGSKSGSSNNSVPSEAQGIANAFGGDAFPEDNFLC